MPEQKFRVIAKLKGEVVVDEIRYGEWKYIVKIQDHIDYDWISISIVKQNKVVEDTEVENTEIEYIPAV